MYINQWYFESDENSLKIQNITNWKQMSPLISNINFDIYTRLKVQNAKGPQSYIIYIYIYIPTYAYSHIYTHICMLAYMYIYMTNYSK